MTNRSDLNECSAQIDLIRQLIEQPETFDLDKILIELETKKKLLMTFKPRSYATILKGLEFGVLKHPGDWVFEEKKVETPKETKHILEARQTKAEEIRLAKEPSKEELEKLALAKKKAEEKAKLEKELQETKDKLATIEAAKELDKEETPIEDIE